MACLFDEACVRLYQVWQDCAKRVTIMPEGLSLQDDSGEAAQGSLKPWASWEGLGLRGPGDDGVSDAAGGLLYRTGISAGADGSSSDSAQYVQTPPSRGLSQNAALWDKLVDIWSDEGLLGDKLLQTQRWAASMSPKDRNEQQSARTQWGLNPPESAGAGAYGLRAPRLTSSGFPIALSWVHAEDPAQSDGLPVNPPAAAAPANPLISSFAELPSAHPADVAEGTIDPNTALMQSVRAAGGNPYEDAHHAPGAVDGVDYGFIAANEGGVLQNGYVPSRHGQAIGKSGVTIGGGVDLGQQSAGGLRQLGVSDDIISTIAPYLGLQTTAAQAYLGQHPLTLSPGQATALTNALNQKTVSTIASNFNAASTTVRFRDLPAGVQTAIADLAFQYGTDLATATPTFWKQVTSGDWQGAIDNLSNWGSYQGRRAAEARLLQKDLRRGLLGVGSSGLTQ